MKHTSLLVFLGIMLAAGVARGQQQDFSKVTIKTTKLTDSIYMLEGSGGNIGVSIGEDGVILIDDQFAPLTGKIQEAVAKLTPKPIKFVINTHWHVDHVGGNENLGPAGAVIVAHDNVRKRMSTEGFIEKFKLKVPASPPKALPIVTFTTDITLHFNGEDIHVIHVDPAHTDGDAIIVFPKAKVVHMGDCYVSLSYPFVDLGSGGSFDGFIAASNKVVGMTDESFKVIPGHGPLSTRAELKSWHDMLVEISALVKKQVDAKKSLEDIQKANLTAKWDEKWGQKSIKPNEVVEYAFKAIKGTH
ncbi:MAG: MBL fold metallo-hydrolase [Deltaproteobacteria bacterium]|nr:MAG: MBL fold metallo-hydrolase [Deltaproteobacteria bacterium]